MSIIKGEAARAIEGFPDAGSSFEAAWEVLRERYEDDEDEYDKLSNNDAHKTSRDVEEKEEEVEIKDETAKAGVEVTRGIHDTVTSIDTTAFLRGHTRDPENLDDSDDQRNASSSSHGIDHTGFVGGSTPPILELGLARKSSESSTSRDDPSAPSASRTPDDHFSGTIANIAGDLTSSSLTARNARGSPKSLLRCRLPV
ncbi:hypothetical protein K0M31_006822 [Melipona bicolor]|uniref:Uncharacterized protein n=1 Tax=Melipona bicolor TaxID=60889 RepID=A0AA40KLC6_9HYME|nr:hypothetical protein K0M31_006822 [Melipona bicolor]